MAIFEESDDKCADVVNACNKHLEGIRAEIAKLKRLEATLNGLILECKPGSQHCAALDRLSSQ